MRILQSFRIFPYTDWLLTVIKRARNRMLIFYIAVLPFYAVMIIILYYQAGQSVEETSSFTSCIFTVIRFALGVGNTSRYYPINLVFYYFWCLVFIFSIYYFLLPVSIALFIEAYEEVTMELGHVSDYAQSKEKGAFKRWVFMCPPWIELARKHKAILDAEESQRPRE